MGNHSPIKCLTLKLETSSKAENLDGLMPGIISSTAKPPWSLFTGEMDHLPSTIFQSTPLPQILVHLPYRVALNTSLVRQTFCITPKWDSMMCNTTSDLCSTNFSYNPQVVQSISSTTTFRYNKISTNPFLLKIVFFF